MLGDIYKKFKIYGVKKFLSYSFYETYRKIWTAGIRKSYSQRGEDLILEKLIGDKKDGFYVDVGANDPDRFSNTKRFYLKGWSGINIEPNIEKYEKLMSQRKRDINLNIGIGRKDGDLEFYKFIPHTLSTFSKYEADRYVAQGFELESVTKLPVRALEGVLLEHCKKEIDFMSIDTEGFDMEVLRGNNWLKFRPRVICIESISHSINGADNKRNDDCEGFLIKRGYKKIYDNRLNSLYIQ